MLCTNDIHMNRETQRQMHIAAQCTDEIYGFRGRPADNSIHYTHDIHLS